MNSMKRYALYFAPRESGDLWRLGSEWLGRCAISGNALKQPAVSGVDAEAFAALAAAPRRYGFHATLKAPFRLAEGKTPHMLLSDVRGWCATQAPFPMPRLAVRMVDDFLALVPEKPGRRLDSIAAECVKRFDRFRAPLSDAETCANRDASRSRPITGAESDSFTQPDDSYPESTA